MGFWLVSADQVSLDEGRERSFYQFLFLLPLAPCRRLTSFLLLLVMVLDIEILILVVICRVDADWSLMRKVKESGDSTCAWEESFGHWWWGRSSLHYSNGSVEVHVMHDEWQQQQYWHLCLGHPGNLHLLELQHNPASLFPFYHFWHWPWHPAWSATEQSF